MSGDLNYPPKVNRQSDARGISLWAGPLVKVPTEALAKGEISRTTDGTGKIRKGNVRLRLYSSKSPIESAAGSK